MERSRDLQALGYLPKNSLSAPHLGIKQCATLRSILKQHTTLLGSFPGSPKALTQTRLPSLCVQLLRVSQPAPSCFHASSRVVWGVHAPFLSAHARRVRALTETKRLSQTLEIKRSLDINSISPAYHPLTLTILASDR